MGGQSHRAPLPASAFAALLQTTQDAVHGFVRQLVGDEDARDVVQDVYVQAWRAGQRASPPFTCDADAPDAPEMEGMRRWLFHAAYHQAISVLRHRRLIPWESLDGADEEDLAVVATLGTRPAEPFEDRVVEGAVLEAALAKLKPTDAAALLLAIVQGFSTAEIAQILGVAPDAARKRLSRAMGRLRVAYFAGEVEPARVRKGAAK